MPAPRGPRGDLQIGAPLGRLHRKQCFASFAGVRAHSPDEVLPWHQAEGNGLHPDRHTTGGLGPGPWCRCGRG